ncbi:MAG: acetylxylan esterase [bacterium]
MATGKFNRATLIFIFILAAVISSSVFAAAPDKAAADARMLAVFNYDAKAPLNERWAALTDGPSYKLYKIVYESANGEKVPALFYEPKEARAPYPCIIMQHGYSGAKEDSKGMGVLQITRAGYAVLAIDAQYHGERRAPGKDIFSTDIPEDAKAMTQTVIDLRRAVDLLKKRKGVDPNRISYIGVSMGAILGSIFAGVETRVKAPVLVVGGGDWKTLVGLSQIGPAKIMRRELEAGNLPSIDKLAAELSFVEPLNFIWRISPRPVLLMNNKHDRIVPTEANRLLQEKAREPKEIVWLDGIPGDPTGHIPPLNEMISKALEWWGKQL